MIRLPHPAVLLLGGTALAAALTWVIPAGEFDRREDPATHRSVVVAGTYHPVPASPVGPFAVAVAVPRGFIEGADVIASVFIVGAAFALTDRLGTMAAVVSALVGAFKKRGLVAIPVLSLFFATMGALENMQEEIIPLVPVLMILGAGLGIDAVSVVAMSVGAAMVGSAFGPTNPFQAGIALRLAQLPPLASGFLRLAMFVVAVVGWIAFTMRYASAHRTEARVDEGKVEAVSTRHFLVLAAVLLPMAFYVYGVTRLDWGFNELSGVFLIGGITAGLIGGLSLSETLASYLESMKDLLPAAILIGVARSISLVLADGRVVDSILYSLASPLANLPAVVAAFLMVPLQALIHVAVPSVSGQAVLTMPLLVPFADLLALSRQVPVLTYQTGAGLMELVTPTNGALMAVLLAARVPYSRWLSFVLMAITIPLAVGLAGTAAAVFF